MEQSCRKYNPGGFVSQISYNKECLLRGLSQNQASKDSEPRCFFIVSHFPYGLPKLPVHSDHGRVTFESNPFHSSEIARLLGNVDASPTDLFLRPLYKLPLNKEEDSVISMSVPHQPLTKVTR